jgi:hypothetical protein
LRQRRQHARLERRPGQRVAHGHGAALHGVRGADAVGRGRQRTAGFVPGDRLDRNRRHQRRDLEEPAAGRVTAGECVDLDPRDVGRDGHVDVRRRDGDGDIGLVAEPPRLDRRDCRGHADDRRQRRAFFSTGGAGHGQRDDQCRSQTADC